MMRVLLLAAAGLGIAWGLAPSTAQANADLTLNTVLEGTGAACLVGGSAAGAVVAAGGPALAVPIATAAAIAPGPTAAAVVTSSLVGCGLGASAAVLYYGANWTYGTFFTGPRFPLLYPPPKTTVAAPASPGGSAVAPAD